MKIMRRLIVIGVGVLVLDVGFVVPGLPSLAAGGLLHPARRRVTVGAPKGCDEVAFQGLGVTLKAWRCGTAVTPRATIVYLHGVADNRVSATGVIQVRAATHIRIPVLLVHGELDRDTLPETLPTSRRRVTTNP